jgi:outer membrane lipoprotein-sorting protein
MRNVVLMVISLTLLMIGNACTPVRESIIDINQKIEDRYKSFTTAKYKLTESCYTDGVLTQMTEYTEWIKKPDKMR